MQKKIIDFLDKNVDEKYYLTTGDFKKIAENKIIFTKKKMQQENMKLI